MKIYNKWTCKIKDYPTEIKVSDSKRAQYWKKGDTLPIKHQGAILDVNGIYRDPVTHQKLIKNTKTAGKPRMLTINAQKIYVGIHHSVRSKIVNELHSLFNREFKAQLPKQIDLGANKVLIGLHFYDVYNSKLPDLDNLANLFVKCGIDCLTTANNPNQVKTGEYSHKLGILLDDKIIFIPHIMYEFTNIDDPKDRRLEFSLYEVSEDFSVEKLCDEYTENLKLPENGNNTDSRILDCDSTNSTF